MLDITLDYVEYIISDENLEKKENRLKKYYKFVYMKNITTMKCLHSVLLFKIFLLYFLSFIQRLFLKK